MVPCLSQDALSGTIKINLCPIQEVVNMRSHLSWALGGVTVRRRSAAHGCADAHTDRRRSDPSSRCLLQVGYQGLWAITGLLKCHILSTLTASQHCATALVSWGNIQYSEGARPIVPGVKSPWTPPLTMDSTTQTCIKKASRLVGWLYFQGYSP